MASGSVTPLDVRAATRLASALLLVYAFVLTPGALSRAIAEEPAPKASGIPDRSATNVGAAAYKWETIRVQAVQVCDDDGGRPATVDGPFIERQVAYASAAFRPARMRFVFDRAHDTAVLRSTIVNNMLGAKDANWREAKRVGNEIAARYRGKMVVFFRHGPGPRPVASSFSSYRYDFIAAAGAPGIGNRFWNLAHEAAHYFSLAHPHPAPEFETAQDAEAYYLQNGRRPELFDGDGLADTPPCPTITELFWKDDVGSITLAGHRFSIPRGNVASYYHYTRPNYNLAPTLTSDQVRRVRWILAMREKNGMAMPNNARTRRPIEAETLTILERKDCEPRLQSMAGFFVGSWSGDAHLFGGGKLGARVTLKVPSARAGRYQLMLAFTHAPDFGVVRVLVDGRPVGGPFDGYGPLVVPSGAIRFGKVRLTAGNHRLTLEVQDKNPASGGYLFGLDCIELRGADKGVR